MKKLFLLTLFIFTSYTFSQEKRFEEVYQQCVYNALPKNGEKFKKYIKGFEQHLISLNILKDNSGKSYLTLFKRLTKGKRYPSEYKYSYIDSINTLEIPILPHNQKCIAKAMKHKSYAHYFSRFFDKKDHKANKDNIEESFKRTSAIMKKSDYKLDFYKHQLFMILFIINEIDELPSLK